MIRGAAAPYRASLRLISLRDIEAAVQRTRPDLWTALLGEIGGRAWLGQQFAELQRELSR